MFIRGIKASRVRLSFDEATREYALVVNDVKDTQIELALSPCTLQALILQGLAYLPQLEPRIVVRGEADAFRKQLAILDEFDDRAIQLLLREIDAATLIDALWYARDGGILRQILRNMSRRAASMLFDDLEKKWSGKNPDEASASDAEKGQTAISATMTTVERLIAEGQIPEVGLKPPLGMPKTAECAYDAANAAGQGEATHG